MSLTPQEKSAYEADIKAHGHCCWHCGNIGANENGRICLDPAGTYPNICKGFERVEAGTDLAEILNA